MAPVTITIDDSDSDQDQDGGSVSPSIVQSKPSKSKSRVSALESSSPNPADDTLPDAISLLFGRNTTNKSTSNESQTHRTKKASGKFRYANLQHTSSPPPQLPSSSPIQSFTDSSQAVDIVNKAANYNSTLNRLDSNTPIVGNGTAGRTSGSMGVGIRDGNHFPGKRSTSTSTSTILKGLDALECVRDLQGEGVHQANQRKPVVEDSIRNNLKRKASSIRLPTPIASLNNQDQGSNSDSNSNPNSPNADVHINLCDSESDDESNRLNIKIPKASKNRNTNSTSTSQSKEKGKEKDDRSHLLFLGQEEDDDSIGDESQTRSPVKKSKPATTAVAIDSDVEFEDDLGGDISFSRIESEAQSKNKQSSTISRQTGKGKEKEVEQIPSSPPQIATKQKKKKSEFLFDSDDSLDWDDPAPAAKKSRSTSATSGGIDKGKGKAIEPSIRATNAELKRIEREEAKAERAREAAEKKAWKQVNLKAPTREFRMTEVIVDIDTAYLKKITDERIPIGFDPILEEHGEALFARLREDKAEVNEIEIGKGLKPIQASILDSILYRMDNSSTESKVLLPTIRFRRKVNYVLDIKRRTKAPLPDGEIRTFVEPTTLILLTSKFLSTLIKNNKLLEEVQKIRNSTDVHHQIFVLVQGLNEDWKKDLLKKQRDYTNQIRRALENPGASASISAASASTSNENETLSKEKVETELMRLRIALRAFVVNVNTKEDAADWVHNIACDIATRTDKLIDASHLSFCPDRAAKCASTSKEAYRLMLQAIPRITEHAADGIMAKYPTMRSLIEAYEDLDPERGNRHGDPNQAQLEMLSHCQISHRTDGQASGRNFDKGLSRRVSQVMVGRDPLMLI